MTHGVWRVTIGPMIPSLLLLILSSPPAGASDALLPEPAPDKPRAHAEREDPEEVQETWVGLISVLGSRKVPLLGKVEFQTDTYVLAQATKISETQWDVTQATCRVNFPKTMGATITLDPKAFERIPTASFSWVIGQDGTWSAGPWKSGWDDTDHEGDGQPGMTLEVAAPFCGGDLYASSEATQTATGRMRDGYKIAGDIRIHVIQKTLGARGPCLGLMARDSDEWMDGQILVKKAPVGTTCDSEVEWPVAEWEGKKKR